MFERWLVGQSKMVSAVALAGGVGENTQLLQRYPKALVDRAILSLCASIIPFSFLKPLESAEKTGQTNRTDYVKDNVVHSRHQQ